MRKNLLAIVLLVSTQLLSSCSVQPPDKEKRLREKTDADALFAIANEQYAQWNTSSNIDELEKAVRNYDQVKERYSLSTRWQNNRYLALFDLAVRDWEAWNQRLHLAYEGLDELVKRSVKPPSLLEYYLFHQEWSDTRKSEFLRRMMVNHPGSVGVWSEASKHFENLGSPDLALAAARLAFDNDKGNKALRNRLAHTYLLDWDASSCVDRSEESLIKTIQLLNEWDDLNSLNPDALELLASAMTALQLFPLAEYITGSLSEHDTAWKRFLHARAALLSGNYDAARETLESFRNENDEKRVRPWFIWLAVVTQQWDELEKLGSGSKRDLHMATKAMLSYLDARKNPTSNGLLTQIAVEADGASGWYAVVNDYLSSTLTQEALVAEAGGNHCRIASARYFEAIKKANDGWGKESECLMREVVNTGRVFQKEYLNAWVLLNSGLHRGFASISC